MAHIKEPEGVDFIIQSDPLTEEARKEITAFIKAYKASSLSNNTTKPKASRVAKHKATEKV